MHVISFPRILLIKKVVEKNEEAPFISFLLQ